MGRRWRPSSAVKHTLVAMRYIQVRDGDLGLLDGAQHAIAVCGQLATQRFHQLREGILIDGKAHESKLLPDADNLLSQP